MYMFPKSNHQASSHSIKLSTPRRAVQILVIFKPADSTSACQCFSVRSVDAKSAIMMISRLVVSQYAFTLGMTFSLMRTLLYPRFMAGTMFDKIFLQFSSVQSCRTECM